MESVKTSPNLDYYAYLYFIMNIKGLIISILPFLCFFFKFFNYNIYCIEDKEKINILYNKIKNDWCMNYDEDKTPWGIVIHKSFFPKYICSIREYKYDPIYLFTYEKKFEKMIVAEKKNGTINLEKIKTNNKVEKREKIKKIKYLMKKGWYGNIHFRSRDVDIRNNNFTKKQEKLYEDIMNFYNENNYAKIFISGDIGTGKTYFSYLFAKYLKCHLCDSFDPTEPSSSIDNVYSSVDHKYNEPLIILIDEVDIILNKITQKEPLHHEKYPIMIKNKIDWNSFLDKVEYGLYKNLIIILCSNMTKKEIDNKYDESFLRKGRINIYSKF